MRELELQGTASQCALCCSSRIDGNAFQLHPPQQKRHWLPDGKGPLSSPGPSNKAPRRKRTVLLGITKSK